MTLDVIRDHIESLACEDGAYYVVCGRTGDRPVPVGGNRFDSRAAARSAARAAEQYRTRLRRYDPRAPYYDPIVCQETDPVGDGAHQGRSGNSGYESMSEPVLHGSAPDSVLGDPHLVGFCHSLAAAVYGSLSENGHDAVETAVMDAYFDLAESVPDPDQLCLCLLERMATELHRRLTPAEQTAVLAGAATRLPAPEPADRPVSATLSLLEARGLLGGYTRSPWSIDLDDGTRSVVLWLSEYALSPRQGRLPVVPIVLGLHRHDPGRPPASLRVADDSDGWRLTLVLADESEPDGVASAPID